MKLKLHYQILIAMLIGAGIGLPLNILAQKSTRFTINRQHLPALEREALSQALRDEVVEHGIELSDAAEVRVKIPGDTWTLHDEHTGWEYEIHLVDDALQFRQGRLRESWPRTLAAYGKGVGDVFLQLLKMIVAPLIFASLITGVTGTGNIKGLGRLGGGTLAYYVCTSMLAIMTGLIMVNVLRPGVGADLATLQAGAEAVSPDILDEDKGVGEILWDQLFTLIPSNPFAALADPTNTTILGVIFFALMLGIFITIVGGEAGETLKKFFASLFEVMMRMTMFIIRLAPIGVLGFMLYASAGKGVDVFIALGWYALTVAVALSFHGFVTLPLITLLLARRSPWRFFQAMSPALLTAFSTASSNGTLPLTISCVENRAGVSNRVSSFVLPLGATINMDGTALYEAVAVLFIAQAYGSDLTLAQQGIVAVTALLASIGAAGIPHAGTVMMVVVLKAVGLPLEAVGLILAVDRVLDMYRTSINVWSDSTACAVMARFAGKHPPPDS